jgi:hypothetical protein
MNLNELAYLTCTLLCKFFLIIMVIYIYIYKHVVNIICDKQYLKDYI